MKVKSGSLYKQKGSQKWWVKYYIPGDPQPIRESTGETDEEEATKYLHKRLGEVATGRFAGLEPERVKVKELFDMLEEDYVIRKRDSILQLKSRLKQHLRPFFDTLKAVQVGTRQINSYIAKRTEQKAKAATINRELEHLRRAFKLGYKAQPPLVLRPLQFDKLREDNVRTGLLEHDAYLALRGTMPEPYKTLFVVGYHLGTRRGELLKLKWAQVDFQRKEITLLGETTKNKKTRVVPIYGDMEAVLKAAWDRRDPKCPWVFQRHGKRFVFTERVWNNIVKRGGSEGLHFHDLRRTALTNMIEAGFAEKEAMEISGHTTDRTFRRYHIIRRERLQQYGERMKQFYDALEQAPAPAEKAVAESKMVN